MRNKYPVETLIIDSHLFPYSIVIQKVQRCTVSLKGISAVFYFVVDLFLALSSVLFHNIVTQLLICFVPMLSQNIIIRINCNKKLERRQSQRISSCLEDKYLLSVFLWCLYEQPGQGSFSPAYLGLDLSSGIYFSFNSCIGRLNGIGR